MIPTTNTHYTFRNADKIPYFKTKHIFFKNYFFSLVIIEWNKLDPSIQRCDSYNASKSEIIRYMRPSSNSFLITIILPESNVLHEFDLELVICESINLKTAYPRCVQDSRYINDYLPLHTVPLSSFFNVVNVIGFTSIKFCVRFFISIKKF